MPICTATAFIRLTKAASLPSMPTASTAAASLPETVMSPFSNASTETFSPGRRNMVERSEEHTSELQSLMRISYAVFCLKKKNNTNTTENISTYDSNKLYARHNI